MKVNQLKRWSFALTAPDAQGIAWATGGAAVALLLVGLYFNSSWVLLLAALSLAIYAVLVKVGLEQYDRLGQTAIEAAASAWVRSGEDEAEVRRRRGSLLELGAAGALAAAGTSASAYLANVDGTPMVLGTAVDIKGNPFGVVSEDGAGLDYSMDAVTNMMLTPDYEYEAPSGMGTDDFMNPL